MLVICITVGSFREDPLGSAAALLAGGGRWQPFHLNRTLMLSSEALQRIHLPVFIVKAAHSSRCPGAGSGRPAGQHYLHLLFHIRNAGRSHQAPLGRAAGGAQG